MGNNRIKLDKIIEINPISKDIHDKLTIGNFNNLFYVFLKVKMLQGLSDVTLNDYRRYKKTLDYYLKQVLGLEESMMLKVEYFIEYINFMKLQKKYSNNTINIRLRYIKSYLNWLKEEEYLKENFNKKIKLMKTPKDTITALDAGQVKKLLKQIDTTTFTGLRDYTLFLTILDTGIRIKEALALEVEDINLNDSIVTVKATNSKTRTERFLPISKRVARLLNELIKISNKNNSNYVFINEYGMPSCYLGVRSAMNRYSQKAGFRCTLYMLRHTYATNAVKAGMDIFSLQRIMGHTELSTTRKYVQLDTKTIQEKHRQANVLEKLLE
ncbi:tyrosine-type recombinase/integrase [Clostridium polynesiense]|uniref:tyrosine-type recombinase/integrase n=1 Tax=Clostridium polynesiense TaxID=1325933 RepID=UPI00058B4AFA|nr:site-specific integrase [Clostridium polynesiense]